MKNCPYCMWEIVDEAKKCKYCWERVVDNRSKDLNKGRNGFKWILLVVLIFIILVLIFLLIRRYKQREFNKELLNNYYDKQISSTWETAMSNSVELLENYIPQTSAEAGLISELSWFLADFSKKINSFSGDLFFIEDKDLHNTYRINMAIDQLEEYKNTINDYVSKFKNLVNELVDEYWSPNELWEYSIFDVLDKMEQYALQEEKLVNKSVEYYSYILTIQDKFYYDEDEEQIYFYSNSSNSSINKANVLRKELYDIMLETFDVEDEFDNFIVEYFKYRKNLLN